MERKVENAGSSKNFLYFNARFSSQGYTVAFSRGAPAYFVLTSLMLLFLLFPFSSAFCQMQRLTPEEIKRPGGDYIWGEGKGDDRDEAREKAYNEMAANVAVTVSSSFESVLKEEGGESQDFITSVVNVNYGGSFREIQPIFSKENGKHVALCYIHKDKLQEGYEEKKNEIISMYKAANENLEAVNVSSALQLYYYCLILMNALPDRTIDYLGGNLKVLIPAKIRNVLENIEIEHEEDLVNNEAERRMQLSVNYYGTPVQCLDFMYLEGGQEQKCKAKGGRAVCELYSAAKQYSRLDVEIEYRYSNERDRSAYTSVDELWNVVSKPSFENNIKVELLTKETKPQPPPQQDELPDVDSSLSLKKETDCPVKQEINKELNKFLGVIKGGQKDISAYADDKFLEKKLGNAFKYNNLNMMSENIQVDINKTWEGWEVRSIPVSCHYPTISTRTVENLVLDFDEEGTLRDFNFVVFEDLYYSQVNPNAFPEDEVLHRQVIVKFLEKYRSAYLNRDMETLEAIFAEEAVIIVGRVIKESKSKRQYELNKDEEQIEYQEFTKRQYLDRQKDIFSRQRDIHLGFSTFNIQRKDDNTNVYGISMRQQYASSGYADEGYLFLLVDFIDEDPKIYVRSWQPQEWTEEKMIMMGDYRVLK